MRASPLLLVCVTTLTSTIALAFTLEALEERRAAADSADLRAAALTIASAHALIGSPLESSVVSLEASVAIIERDHTDALHSLTPAEASRVEVLLAGLGTMAHSEVHSADEHNELQTLLERATSQARADAASAERRAAASLIVALIAVAGMVAAFTSARQRSERAAMLARSEADSTRRLEALLNDLPDMLAVFAADGTMTYRSAAVDRLLARDGTLDELVDRAHPDARSSLRTHLTDAPTTSAVFELGTTHGRASFDLHVNDLTDDERVGGLVVTARDVTAELALRAELKQLAAVDVLTGLANRRALEPVLDQARRAAGDQHIGFLLVDFDDFKEVNDTLGHLVGDQLLREASTRLLGVLRASESLLRLGGDEFAIVLAPVSDERGLVAAAERVQATMDQPFEFEEATERVRTSIGGVVLDAGADAEEMLGKADIALYEAKRAGGNRLVVFEQAMEAKAIGDAAVARALRTVDPDAEFDLHFQPIVDAISSDTVSIEALLRWTSPTLGSVSPGRFIPIAERLGLMPKLGAWVMDAVCQQVARWECQNLADHVTVAFNVSAQQLAEPRFVESVFAAAERVGVRPSRLAVEVTESMFIEPDSVIIDRLAALRDGGVRVAIDDFGSGYSNLGQLVGIPLDTIKIDRELLLRLAEMRDRSGGDPTDPCAIMQAIVTIASMLQAPVVCEGVETPEQRASLRASGVTYLQGYLLGRPGPASQLDIPTEKVLAAPAHAS